MIHVEALVLQHAGRWIPVGGDGTWVDGRGRPSLLRPLSVPLHVPMLRPFPFASTLIKASTPCWFLTETKEVGLAGLAGAGRPRTWPKKFQFFFVKFSDAKLSNLKHGLVEIRNMIKQVGKKIMQREN